MQINRDEVTDEELKLIAKLREFRELLGNGRKKRTIHYRRSKLDKYAHIICALRQHERLPFSAIARYLSQRHRVKISAQYLGRYYDRLGKFHEDEDLFH